MTHQTDPRQLRMQLSCSWRIGRRPLSARNRDSLFAPQPERLVADLRGLLFAAGIHGETASCHECDVEVPRAGEAGASALSESVTLSTMCFLVLLLSLAVMYPPVGLSTQHVRLSMRLRCNKSRSCCPMNDDSSVWCGNQPASRPAAHSCACASVPLCLGCRSRSR